MGETKTILSEKQYDRAFSWYIKHEKHVKKLLKYADKGYPPSLSEDKNDPRLWKPEHWAWFKSEFVRERTIKSNLIDFLENAFLIQIGIIRGIREIRADDRLTSFIKTLLIFFMVIVLITISIPMTIVMWIGFAFIFVLFNLINLLIKIKVINAIEKFGKLINKLIYK
jgi:hypothetical protein